MHICMYYSSRDILLLEWCNNKAMSTDIITHHQSTTCRTSTKTELRILTHNVGIKKLLLYRY